MLLERCQWSLVCSCILMLLVPTKLSATSESEAVIRPQMHFTPPTQWMNDPNGMVFHNGEYHMFYQHYPEDKVWGPMHWGHAVSKDLIQWNHLPIALYPDQRGMIFSGSAVIDEANTSGLGSIDNPAMVAIFTYHDETAKQAGSSTFQSQGLAYSTDNGRTWLKHPSNPVLKNPGLLDFRDPKVSWHSPSNRWVMVVTLGDEIGFYSSPNLFDWTFESRFGEGLGAHEGVWECPDLIEIDGQYVLIVSLVPGGPNGGSGTQYFIGEFDGEKFTPHAQHTTNPSKAFWLDWGPDNYAGVTYSGIKSTNGLPIFLGWANNWQYAVRVPATTWRSMLTLPRELYLYREADKQWLGSRPIREVISSFSNQITNLSKRSDDLPIDQPARIVIVIENSEFEIDQVVLQNQLGEQLVVALQPSTGTISMDRRLSGVKSFSDEFPIIATSQHNFNDNTTLLELYYDGNLVELFVDGGKTSMSMQVFPLRPFDSLTVKNVREIQIFSAALPNDT